MSGLQDRCAVLTQMDESFAKHKNEEIIKRGVKDVFFEMVYKQRCVENKKLLNSMSHCLNANVK